MHLDHIVPLRAGGIHDAKNLQAMCGTCNIKKSDQLNPDISVDEILERDETQREETLVTTTNGDGEDETTTDERHKTRPDTTAQKRESTRIDETMRPRCNDER